VRKELPFHTNVVRFIEDQILDQPTVQLRKKTRAECDAILKGALYEQVGDSYDYIMRLPVSSFTKEEIDKHHKTLGRLRAEIAALEQMKPAEMWFNEITCV
jgi:hypothetical protein